MRILQNKNKKIKKIYHISDIHIRLIHRKQEYLTVFENLYKFLETKKDDSGLIVITGDLLHSKLELSPECCDITIDFLRNLCNFFPVILIAGNHDALLNNLSRTDSISSILYHRDISNLYYLKDTDIYQFENIAFYVESLIDKTNRTLMDLNFNIDKSLTKIGLYHGQISGWKNCNGYISESGEKNLADIPKFDYTLLGDIHKYQFMGKNIAYAGSLISQNYGETNSEHGVLIWDLEKNRTDFKIIENPYRYMIINCIKNRKGIIEYNIDNEMYANNLPLPKYAKVKLITNMDDFENRDLLINLKKEFSGCSFLLSQKETENEIVEIDNFLSDDKKIAEEYIGKLDIDPEGKKKILDYIMKEWISSEINNSSYSLISLSFDNLFGYGPDNKFIFPKNSNNVIGIFGDNSIGKSSLIDIITLLLFSKVTRFSHGMTIPKETINFDKNKGSGEIIIKYMNEYYLICKKFSRGKENKINTIQKLFLVSYNNNDDSYKIINELTDEHRKKTDEFIQKIIGNYETFIYTNFFLQQKEKYFKDLSSMEKKKMLYDIFGYSWFEKLEKKMKDEIKKITIEEKTFENVISNKTKQSFQNKIIELQNVITQEKNKKKECDNNLNKLKDKLKQKLLDISFPIVELKEKVSYTIQALQKDLCLMKSRYNNLLKKQEVINNKISKSSFSIVSYNDNEIYKRFSPFFQDKNDFEEWERYKDKYVTDNIENNKKELEILDTKYIKFSGEIKNYSEDYVWKDTYSFHKSLEMTKIKNYKKNFSINDLNENLDIFIRESNIIEKEYNIIKKEEYKEFDHEEYSIRYNKLQKLYNDLNMNKVQSDISINKLNDANTIEFNLKCSSCKKNPYYCQKIEFEKETKELEKKEKTIKRNIEKEKKYFKNFVDINANDILQNINDFVLKQVRLQKQLLDMKSMMDIYVKIIKKIENTIQFLTNITVEKKINSIMDRQKELKDKITNYYEYKENKDIFDVIDKEYKLYEDFDNQKMWESDKKKNDSEISILEKNIYMLENGLIEKENNWTENKKIFNEIQILEKRIKEYEKSQENLVLDKSIVELDLLEKEFENWCDNYKLWRDKKTDLILKTNISKIIDKDGLPFILLTNKMNMIEKNINELIEPFIDTKIKFDIDKKNIDVGNVTQLDGVYSHYDGGMQKFIINLCFKMIFSKYSLIPKSNFFIIDEGISVLDKKHLHEINYLLTFLSTLTTNIFLISHIPQIRDFVDIEITIEKKKYSKLKN